MIDGLIIRPPEVLKEIRDVKIIVAVGEYWDIFEQLNNYGISGERYCYYKELLLIKEYEERGCISIPEITFMVTNRCTLSCKGCIQYVSYMSKEEQKDNSYDAVINSIDCFFHYAKQCESVHIMGGETFLYQKIKQVVEYLYDKYVVAGRIGKICMTTNGTLIPEEEVLRTLKKYDVEVIISDYRKAIQRRSKVEELTRIFEGREIKYLLQENYGRSDKEKWFDMGNPFRSRQMTEPQLRQHYAKCCIDGCMTVWDSKLFNCMGVEASVMNLKKEETYNDYCDLKTDNAIRFIKYYLGYNDKGYFDFCNFCNGWGKYLNRSAILPGVQ